jgi:hypothetical protein
VETHEEGKMNANKVISILTAILVTFLAGAAFVLSFDNLRTLALANGVTPGLVALWPLGLDAMVVVSCLTVLRGSLSNERTLFAWALVFAFTAASIAFNVLTSATWLARSIHALPAIVVFLSLELLTGQLKSTIRRTLAVRSLAEIERATERQRVELSELERRAYELSNVQPEQTTPERKTRTPSAERSVLLNEVLAYLAQNPNASFAQVGETFGKSKSTVKAYTDELSNAGRLRRNGDGWTVAAN